MRVLFSGAPLYGHLMPLLPLARALVRRGDEVAFAVPPSLAPVLASEDVEIFPAGAEPLAIRAEILRRIGVNTATGPTADSDCEAFAGAGLDLAVEQVLAVAQEWRPDLVIGDVFSYTTLLVAACVHVPAAHVTLRHEVGEFEHALRAMAAKRFEARGLTFRPPSWVLDICPSDLQVPGWRKPPPGGCPCGRRPIPRPAA